MNFSFGPEFRNPKCDADSVRLVSDVGASSDEKRNVAVLSAYTEPHC